MPKFFELTLLTKRIVFNAIIGFSFMGIIFMGIYFEEIKQKKWIQKIPQLKLKRK